jgi:hypothetical protein
MPDEEDSENLATNILLIDYCKFLSNNICLIAISECLVIDHRKQQQMTEEKLNDFATQLVASVLSEVIEEHLLQQSLETFCNSMAMDALETAFRELPPVFLINPSTTMDTYYEHQSVGSLVKSRTLGSIGGGQFCQLEDESIERHRKPSATSFFGICIFFIWLNLILSFYFFKNGCPPAMNRPNHLILCSWKQN